MTAVQWLINELKSGDFDNAPISVMLGIIEKAIEMEKEQIIDAYQANSWGEPEGAEQYYKEKYEQGK